MIDENMPFVKLSKILLLSYTLITGTPPNARNPLQHGKNKSRKYQWNIIAYLTKVCQTVISEALWDLWLVFKSGLEARGQVRLGYDGS